MENRVHPVWRRLHEVPNSQKDLWHPYSTGGDFVSQKTFAMLESPLVVTIGQGVLLASGGWSS